MCSRIESKFLKRGSVQDKMCALQYVLWAQLHMLGKFRIEPTIPANLGD